MSTILSFDHGTITGYSLFKDGKYIKSGILQLSSIENLYSAYNIYETIFANCKPHIVVVEKVNVAGSKFGGNNVIKLAQLQAMIKLLCQTYNSSLFEVNPMSMKKIITGNGRSEKTEVAKVVAEMWNLEVDEICVPVWYKRKDEIKGYKADESDAIALGTYYLLTKTPSKSIDVLE